MRSDASGTNAAARLQLLRGEEPSCDRAAEAPPVLVGPAGESPASTGPPLTDRLPPWLSDALAGRSRSTVVTVVTVVLAVVVGGGALLHHRGATQPAYAARQSVVHAGDAGTAGASLAATDPSGAAAGASIVVDVGGRVRHPGLVTLPAGSRVADAITAAGGALRRKEVARLDLAAKVADGQLLLVGVTGAPTTAATDASGASGSPTASTGPVDLNSASAEELDSLPGIGPVTAQKIIDWRTAHNGFTDVAQLQQVSGIGPVTYNDLKGLVSA